LVSFQLRNLYHMFLVIAVASCASSETFSRIYTLVAEFLSLSRTTLSVSLQDSPNPGHFLCYALLSLSLAGVFSRRRRYLAPLVAVGFGILMAIVQIFTPFPGFEPVRYRLQSLGSCSGVWRLSLVA